MTVMLMVIIPLALARDYFCAKHISVNQKRRRGIACCFALCLAVFFVIDALILEVFIEHDLGSASYLEVLWHFVGLVKTGVSA